MDSARVNVNVDGLKPVAKSLKSIESLKVEPNLMVTAKADGEFTVVTYEEGKVVALNRWGRARWNMKLLDELGKALSCKGIRKAVLICELYAVAEDGGMLRVNDFISIIKGKDDLLIEKQVKLCVFDINMINDVKPNESYRWRLDELTEWLKDCELCHAVPFIQPTSLEDVKLFWRKWVEEKGWEGLFARCNSNFFKIKPVLEVDAVVVGINKKSRFREKEVTSLRVALMDKEGVFVELGDVASGIDLELRKALWKLIDYKVGEDDDTIWIKPFLVVKVEFTDTFQGECRRFSFKTDEMFGGKEGYVLEPPAMFYHLRHPRLLGFRQDKKVEPYDLRLEQIAVS